MTLSRIRLIWWQFLFILLGSSWLWAPQLDRMLSPRNTLISQYEAPMAAYGQFFRTGDVLAAILMLLAAIWLKHSRRTTKAVWITLMVIGAGMLIDPLFASACRPDQASCVEHISFTFAVHAIETVMTASAIFFISVYDSWRKKRLVSIAFVVFQGLYGLLYLSQAAHNLNTITQYTYQTISLLWLAWYAYGELEDAYHLPIRLSRGGLVRNIVAVWTFFNGLVAIVASLAHVHLLGNAHGFYFAGDSAWLAQHGVIVGTVMIYLSRHLARGERRARQILLFFYGVEVLKYSLITPNPILALYLITFVVLFVSRDEFSRGTVVLTWKNRLKEAAFMTTSLAVVTAIGLVLVNRDNEHAEVAAQAIDHFFDYAISSKVVPASHIQSALLAHTISAFVLIGLGTIFWILFRPYRSLIYHSSPDAEIKELLQRYSNSSEDYFKLWPMDKQYFKSDKHTGFIAYKAAGPTVFALADPIAPSGLRQKLITEFIAENRSRRLNSCFIMIFEENLELYKKSDMNTVHIGASAVVNCDDFLNNTIGDKWWRWQRNRAKKAGYEYGVSKPPHDDKFLSELRKISDSWLEKGGHEERGFALGYFDETYLQKCSVHYLKDSKGKIVAFVNRLPILASPKTTTVDLMRYREDANNAMPYLISETIQSAKNEGFEYFDLGFVPFTSSKGPMIRLAKLLNSGRFSARGLEQFKNKFKPNWTPNYMAYDGDLADLALIALSLEKVMEK